MNVCDEERGAFAFYTWSNVLVAVWRSAVTEDAVHRLTESSSWFAEKHSAIHVVESGSGLPTPGARSALVRLMRHRESKLACIAVVLCGRGFWASAFQGAVTGIHMLAPRSLTLRICSDAEAVAQWLPDEHRSLTGVAVDPDALRAAVAEARMLCGRVAA